MRKMIAVLLIGATSGCATTQDVAMKVEKDSSDYSVLIGDFKGAIALVQGDPSNASIHVSNGSLSCEGASNNGRFETDMISKNKISYIFGFHCSDGTSGLVPLKITAYSGGRVQGIGSGVLSNGFKVKVIVGDLSGTIGW